MLPGFARCAGIAAVAIGMALALVMDPAGAQSTPPAAAPASPPAAAPASPPAAAKPAAAPTPAPVTPVAPEGIETKPGDPFGKDVTLTPKPIVYLKGSGTWENAFAIISGALKKIEAYVEKAGLKADGLPMTIFLATDDRGFDYEAAIPLAQPPKDQPQGEMAFGQSPGGHALEFVHRGSYESLDDTYEAIMNYLDEKGLDSKNVLIEQYVTDPATGDEKNLDINVFVLID
jgi:effector-binding domain-containing protein